MDVVLVRLLTVMYRPLRSTLTHLFTSIAHQPILLIFPSCEGCLCILSVCHADYLAHDKVIPFQALRRKRRRRSRIRSWGLLPRPHARTNSIDFHSQCFLVIGIFNAANGLKISQPWGIHCRVSRRKPSKPHKGRTRQTAILLISPFFGLNEGVVQ